MRAVDIFIAYSQNDLYHKDELKKFLRPLLNTGKAQVWDDQNIEGGQDWEAESKKHLYGADIILLLVSPDSLASDYFYGQEVTVSLERHDKGEAAVVPVILRPCAWAITPLQRLEALPEKGRPVTSWSSQDEAYAIIAHNIGRIVESRQALLAAASQQEEHRRDFSAEQEQAAAISLETKRNEPEVPLAAADHTEDGIPTETSKSEAATTIPALQDWLQNNTNAHAADRSATYRQLQQLRKKREQDIQRAKTAIGDKDYPEAEKIILEILTISPNDAEALKLKKSIHLHR